jgi:hypothetical protein
MSHPNSSLATGFSPSAPTTVVSVIAIFRQQSIFGRLGAVSFEPCPACPTDQVSCGRPYGQLRVSHSAQYSSRKCASMGIREDMSYVPQRNSSGNDPDI